MSAPEESLNDQDPDYVSATSNDQIQQKIYEENARNTTAKKIIAIVEREFSQEIDLKEKEILQIQEKLHKALKIFHLLRYVIITNFYNRKQCQIPQAAETTKQTRIHPAIKTLLGKCPKSSGCTDLAVPSTSTDPRFLYDDKSLSSDTNSTADDALTVERTNANKRDGEKRKILDEESQPRKVPRYVPPKSSIPEQSCPSRGNSHKIRKRIIVGNISKWIPPDWREDASSHKWTMYVRGDQENANISTFVSKVRFFLHPSYRPNDVVEVTSYPFHLSRRGWGEFPLRVQLHFKNVLNKPMDIIHHLKLDRTYTGLQTLGSETVVDTWIHTAESRNPEENNSDELVESSVNESFIKRELNDGNSSDMSLSVSTFEEIQAKKEMSDSKKREQFNLSLDLIKNFESVKIKTESNNTITRIFDDEREEATTTSFHIEHDHNYCHSKNLKSHHYIIKEENVTVEHFPENDCTISTIDSPVKNNKKKSDITATSNRFNGDIQSSSNHQPLEFLNATINDTLVASNSTFQENDSQKHVSFDTDKFLRTKSLKKESALKILETTSTKRTVTINGALRSSDASFDHFDNLQKAASSSEICNSHLKPLQISIPSSNILTSSTSKHVLLLKDKKSIPVDFTSLLPSRSNENSKVFVDGDVRVSVPRDGSVAKLNVRVPQGVSILKKQHNVKVNTQQEDAINNKKTSVLKLKGTNSLLLNVNENVPILKIADTCNPRYNYNVAGTAKGVSSIPGKQESALNARSEKTTVQRPKITLGKDKFKIQSKRDLYEAVLRTIDTVNITEPEALIRFIVRRLPIVTQDARDPEYRRLHPYACCSDEYQTYNVGKQRAIEWYRAKTIKDLLQMKSIPSDQLWSIKEIILWTRLHGYTPSRSAFGVQETAGTKKLHHDDVTTSTAIFSTCTEPIALHKWLETCQQEPNRQSTDNCTDDEDIDVETVEESSRRIAIDRRRDDSNQISNCSSGSTLIPIELDENLLPLHNFVCDTARDIGIKIGPEEIVPGVLYCAASRVMIKVVECFVEDLARSSLAKAWERNSGNECPKAITLNDVRNALTSREEFDIFTNEGLGSKQELNTAEL